MQEWEFTRRVYHSTIKGVGESGRETVKECVEWCITREACNDRDRWRLFPWWELLEGTSVTDRGWKTAYVIIHCTYIICRLYTLASGVHYMFPTFNTGWWWSRQPTVSTSSPWCHGTLYFSLQSCSHMDCVHFTCSLHSGECRCTPFLAMLFVLVQWRERKVYSTVNKNLRQLTLSSLNHMAMTFHSGVLLTRTAFFPKGIIVNF